VEANSTGDKGSRRAVVPSDDDDVTHRHSKMHRLWLELSNRSINGNKTVNQLIAPNSRLTVNSSLSKQAMRAYGMGGGIEPFILNLGTRWKRVISLIP
jgi:hypothetical protein